MSRPEPTSPAGAGAPFSALQRSQSLGARLAQALSALPLLLLAAWIVWDSPVLRPWLALLMLTLAAAQWLRPTAWLVALPALLPVLQLGPWSGRLLLNEFDAVLSILAATALLGGHYAGGYRQIMRVSYLPLWLLGLTTLIALSRGLFPTTALDANAWSGYLSSWNALRVGRPMLWALLMAPLLLTQLAHDRRRAESDFTLGVVAGIALFGVAVLWERGFFLDLFTARDIWGLTNSWLNLAANYRITGPFTQMQFGGEAVDGYIVLSWPFALLLMLKAKRPWQIALGTVALLLIAYACLVTFTRTTYAAVAIGAVLAFLPLLRRLGRRGAMAALAPLSFAAITTFGSWIGFGYGGVLVLMAVSGVILAGALVGYLSERLDVRIALVAFAVALLAGMGLALRGILGSKYHETDPITALGVALPLIAIAGAGAWWLGARAGAWGAPRIALVALLVLVLIPPIIALALGNTRMEVRFGSVTHDLQVRINHWQSVTELANLDTLSMLFGQGLGRFPAASLGGQRSLTEGVYLHADGALRITASKHLFIGQRLPHLARQPLRALIRYRAVSGSPSLAVQLAHRPMLVQEWFRDQINGRHAPKPASQDWQQIDIPLDAGKLQASRWFRPGFTLFSVGARGNGILEIDRIQLLDVQGREQLANGTFDSSLDRWFAYNDYDHLAWHAKNLFLIIWFDQGILGLLTLLVFLVPAFSRLSKRAAHGEHLPLALIAALAGFLLLGLTSTLFDVPRITLLFWLMATMGLFRARQHPSNRSQRERGPKSHQRDHPNQLAADR